MAWVGVEISRNFRARRAGCVQRRNRFKAAVGGSDSPAGDGVDVRMEIQAVSVALNGEDDARQGGRIGGNLLEHLLERLPRPICRAGRGLWGGI